MYRVFHLSSGGSLRREYRQVSVTGYERQVYADIGSIADSLKRLDATLEMIRFQMVKDHEQRERHANTHNDARNG